jgi:REP element-mobilizing transposase RayT
LAQILEETLFRFHGVRYKLIAWCIMPNHVHTLILPRTRLALIVQSWKSFTGRWALARNAELGLGIPGKRLWMQDYWDRYMRNFRHLEQVMSYIHQNPVVAGLCERAEAWPWSSAGRYSGSA